MAEYCDSFSFSENNQDHYDMVPNDKDSYQFWQGLRGPYYTPVVGEDGYLYWTNNGQLPNPEPVKIVGKDGRGITLTGQCETVAELPEDPDQGEAWAVGEEEPFECYAWFGEWVDMGLLFPAGQDGVSPTVTMTAITGGTRLTITDKDHPGGQSTDIMNGSPGNPGQDGVSPAVSMEAITGGTRLTITDKDHPGGQSTDIMNGAAGQGVPAGGTAGQFYRKASGTDYDGEWHTLSAGDSSYDSSLTYSSGTVGDELNSQRNTLNQLDGAKAAKANLTSISQTSPNCSEPSGILKGTYFYLDGNLVQAISNIGYNAPFTSSNYAAVTAGGLNAINNNLDPTLLLSPTLATTTATTYNLNDSVYNYRLILICLGADAYRTQASNLIAIVNTNLPYDVRFTDTLSASVVFTSDSTVELTGSWNVSIYGINKK